MTLTLRRRALTGISAFSLGTMLCATVFAVPASAMGTEPEPTVKNNQSTDFPVTDQFIVKFSEKVKNNAEARNVAYSKLEDELNTSVKEVKKTNSGSNIISVDGDLSKNEVKEIVETLKEQPNVISVEPDAILQVAADPNDPGYSIQWSHFDSAGGVNIPAAWSKTTGKDQVVAVIDTGITKHSDLDANILPGYDMINTASNSRDGDGRDSDASDNGDYRVSGDCGVASSSDSSWHGTHVAGIISAIANNGSGIAGAAPESKIVPVRALGTCGGYSSDVADGILWSAGASVAGVPANANPASVINLSLGGAGQCGSTMQNAINTAVGLGSVVIAAAGNENMNAGGSFIASCNNVVVVASSGPTGEKAPYSNFGSVVDVTAPGGDSRFGAEGMIVSTLNSGLTSPESEGYAYMEGTSMATPLASAVAALVIAGDPSLTPAQVESRLKETAKPMPVPCDAGCGAGIVDASKAVIVPAAAPAPAPAPTPAPEPTITSTKPTITGTAKVGSALTVNSGTWDPAPVTLSQQWYRSGVAIPGAIGTSYMLTASDYGKQISVTVTGSKTGYADVQQTSASTSAVAAGTLTSAKPTITGTTKVGSALTVNAGSWGPAPVTLKQQWYRSGTAIVGATGTSYTLTPSDSGKNITVAVTGSKAGYVSVRQTSAATAAVVAGTLTSAKPTITGTAKVGSALTFNPGTWGPAPVTFKQQWYRSGVAILGATGSSYTLTPSDLGKNITVAVTGSKTGYSAVRQTSVATAAVVAGTLTSAKPTITGTAKVGSALTVNPGTWGPAPVTLKQQWYRSGVAILGATGTSYTPTAADWGKNITVAVTGSKTGYTAVRQTSVATAAVAAGTITSAKPTITGTAKVGSTLTVNPGTWGPAPVTLNKQWYRSGVAISGATGTSYTLTSSDRGKQISVGVRGSKTGYNSTDMIKSASTGFVS